MNGGRGATNWHHLLSSSSRARRFGRGAMGRPKSLPPRRFCALPPRRFFAAALAALALFAAVAPRADACTTFCLASAEGVYFGKNYDWQIGRGLLFVNKRGLAKAAMLDAPQRPARWVAKYGSLTFNQYGREHPHGGINEAGLVVELMWLDAAEYPAPDERPAVDVLAWVQYQLDNFATVGEVVEHGDRLRIASQVKLHYLVADRDGRAAAIEFLGGKLVAHSGASLPAPVLANDTYAESVAYLKAHAGFGGTRALPRGSGSLERFARAASLVKGYKPGARPAVEYAFDVLADVAQPGATQWSIVYDLKNLRAHFRTRDNPRVRTVALPAFDLSCAGPAKMLDMNAPDQGGRSGDATAAFRDYTREANRALVEFSFRNTSFLAGVPAPALDALAAFPESMPCSR